MTRFGLSAGLPSAARRFCQRRLSARPPSIAASLEPVVEQPVASSASGACQRWLRMLTQRVSSSAVCGYSSLSIMFLSKHSAISFSACGSIQVADERRHVEARVAVEHQLVVDDLVRDVGRHLPVRQLVPRNRPGLEAEDRAHGVIHMSFSEGLRVLERHWLRPPPVSVRSSRRVDGPPAPEPWEGPRTRSDATNLGQRLRPGTAAFTRMNSSCPQHEHGRRGRVSPRLGQRSCASFVSMRARRCWIFPSS